MPAIEVSEQLVILVVTQVVVTHVASPNDSGVGDVRLVVDPVTVDIVMWAVPDNDEMITWNLSQLGNDLREIDVTARPGRFQWGMSAGCGDAKNNHRQTNHRETAD